MKTSRVNNRFCSFLSEFLVFVLVLVGCDRNVSYMSKAQKMLGCRVAFPERCDIVADGVVITADSFPTIWFSILCCLMNIEGFWQSEIP